MNIGRIKTTNHNFAAIVKRFLNETGYDAFSIALAAFKAAYMPGSPETDPGAVKIKKDTNEKNSICCSVLLSMCFCLFTKVKKSRPGDC